jgi:preprotein translocase subunit SecD
MSRKPVLTFCIVILVIGLFSYLALAGLPSIGLKGVREIRTGIDIRGGISTTLYPDTNDLSSITTQQLESAVAIIEKRLNGKGVYDMNIAPDNEYKRIVVEIPYTAGQDTNPQKVIDELGRTAYLTFQEVDEDLFDGYVDAMGSQKKYLPTGKIVVQGTEIEDAQVGVIEGRPVVLLKMNSTGAEKFAEATARLKGQKIAIFLDDVLITAPQVNDTITSGEAYIEGNMDARRAADLAATIRSGALPFKLVPKEINSITPTLGEGALRVAIQAGIVSFILVFLFMAIYYRLPGLMAGIALIFLVVTLLLLMSSTGITLTLPGIAGIILTLGMGVDANVIINERIREELGNGKSLKAAIEGGYKRAFTSILDSNVTTLITVVVLYVMGTGVIKGFAHTLGYGIVISFISSVLLSRILITNVSRMKFAKDKRLYGVKEVAE